MVQNPEEIAIAALDALLDTKHNGFIDAHIDIYRTKSNY